MEHLREEAGLEGLLEVLSIFVSGVTDQSGAPWQHVKQQWSNNNVSGQEGRHAVMEESLKNWEWEPSEYRNRVMVQNAEGSRRPSVGGAQGSH